MGVVVGMTQERMARIAELKKLDLDALLVEVAETDGDEDLLTEIGRRYLRERDFACAEDWFGRALAINPKDPCASEVASNSCYPIFFLRDLETAARGDAGGLG